MAKKKKGKKISTKMLSAMLPVLILGMAVLGAVSVFSSKQIIDDEIGKEMTLSLENEKTEVQSQMQSADLLNVNIRLIPYLTDFWTVIVGNKKLALDIH